MIRTLKPLPGKLLVQRIFAIRSDGGIEYARRYAQADDKQRIVLAVGSARKNEPMEVAVGDHVVIEMLVQDRQPIEDGTGRQIIDYREVVAKVMPIAVPSTAATPACG